MKKTGFTLLEISLFLGITMLLVVGLMASGGGSISRERYNDTVNDVVEFFRTAYYDVTNVQNSRTDILNECNISESQTGKITFEESTNQTDAGRTSCALYGKLITFGENSDNANNNVRTTIYVYDVIGKITKSGTFANDIDTLNALATVRADIISVVANNDTTCNFKISGAQESYNLQWQGEIRDKDNGLFEGAILIIRSPASGTVHTYVSEKRFGFQKLVNPQNATDRANYRNPDICNKNNAYKTAAKVNGVLTNISSTSVAVKDFETKNLSLFVHSEDSSSVGNRSREICFAKDGHSANAISLIDLDAEGDNRCE